MDYLNEHKNETIQIVTSGRKAEEFAKRYLASVQMPNVHVGACFNGFPDKPTIDHVKPFSQLTVNPYVTNQIDRLDILSSKFVSTLVQKPTLKTLLPIAVPPDTKAKTENSAIEFLFEPSKAEVIDKIVPALINRSRFAPSVVSPFNDTRPVPVEKVFVPVIVVLPLRDTLPVPVEKVEAPVWETLLLNVEIPSTVNAPPSVVRPVPTVKVFVPVTEVAPLRLTAPVPVEKNPEPFCAISL
jgi:hypothetical protein